MIETGDTLPLDSAHRRDSDDGSGKDAGDFHGCGEGKGGGGDQSKSCDNVACFLCSGGLTTRQMTFFFGTGNQIY